MKRIWLGILLMALPGLAIAATSRETAGVWLDVPFVKQTEDGCGSAAISMLLQYWQLHGAAVASGRADATAIQRELYSRKAHGIFASDMERYVTESGFRVFTYRAEWSDFQEHLSQGRPLIVSLKPGKLARLHYVLIVGIDQDRDGIFVNDPARGKLLRMGRSDFEKEWRAAGKWTLLAVPQRSE